MQDAKVDILGTGISHDHWRVLDIAADFLSNDFLGGACGRRPSTWRRACPSSARRPTARQICPAAAREPISRSSWPARASWNRWAHGFGLMLGMQGQYSFSPLDRRRTDHLRRQADRARLRSGRHHRRPRHRRLGGVALYDISSTTCGRSRRSSPMSSTMRRRPSTSIMAPVFDPSLTNETIASAGGGIALLVRSQHHCRPRSGPHLARGARKRWRQQDNESACRCGDTVLSPRRGLRHRRARAPPEYLCAAAALDRCARRRSLTASVRRGRAHRAARSPRASATITNPARQHQPSSIRRPRRRSSTGRASRSPPAARSSSTSPTRRPSRSTA